MEYPHYKKFFTKPPSNGWHVNFDGYDIRRGTRGELESALRSYMDSRGMEGDAARLVEIAYCNENPSQCHWGSKPRNV